MKKYVFLILHYCSIEDTIKCVDSIFNNCTDISYEIIIVDNGSRNCTGNILKNKYNNNSNIHILLSEKNLGFANGNNIGFKFAKENLKPDYIIMINNDIEMIDKSFCKEVDKLYLKYNFDVLGPKIILPDGSNNKYRNKLNTVSQQRKTILYIFFRLLANYLFFTRLIEFIKKKKSVKVLENDNKDMQNVILHGSCLIFSINYINKFDGIDSRTFLYCEEELLFIRLQKNNMISVYSPLLKILHNEDGSTNYSIRNQRDRNIFVNKNLLKSNIILLKELKGMNQND